MNKGIVEAVKKALEADAKRTPEERFQRMIDAGIIDETGRVFSENLRMVEDLLRAKGFDDISAFHRGTMPGGAVRLHEKAAQGRQAEASYERMRQIIKKARSQEGLWKALEAGGHITRPRAASRKKTG